MLPDHWLAPSGAKPRTTCRPSMGRERLAVSGLWMSVLGLPELSVGSLSQTTEPHSLPPQLEILTLVPPSPDSQVPSGWPAKAGTDMKTRPNTAAAANFITKTPVSAFRPVIQPRHK
jgi:hypothetical protein